MLLAPVMLLAQAGGVMPDWEVREAALALEKHTKAVDGLLDQLRPEEWTAQGAPAAYVAQLKQSREFNSYLAAEAGHLAEQPGRLSTALNAFLRLDYLQSLLDSVTAGARRYQNAALADLLASAISQNSTTRELLKEYTRQLAIEREKEWEIANLEAQRCRAILSKRPPATPRKPPAKPAPKP